MQVLGSAAEQLPTVLILALAFGAQREAVHASIHICVCCEGQSREAILTNATGFGWNFMRWPLTRDPRWQNVQANDGSGPSKRSALATSLSVIRKHDRNRELQNAEATVEKSCCLCQSLGRNCTKLA